MGGEKEVYVDFSEEVVEEEVVQSGPTEENVAPSAFDKLQAAMPPAVAEYVDKLKDSYSKNRKQYLIGLAVIGIIILVVIVGAFLFFGSSSDSGLSKDEMQQTFIVGPIVVPHGDKYEDFILDVPRPPGNIGLHRVDISIVDNMNETIPLYVLYNHHALLVDKDGVFVAGVGAESAGVPGLNLPKPYVRVIDEDDTWALSAELINVWGLASGADLEVYVRYDVTYSDFDAEQYTPAVWDFIGNGGENRDDVSKSCEHYSQNTCKFVYDDTWDKGDSTIVVAYGHIHIGAINMTLVDITNDNTLAVATPIYDESGSYIISIDSEFEPIDIKDGTKLRITSYYSTEHNYKEVMSLFQIWGTFESEPLYSLSDSDNSSSAKSSEYSYSSPE